MILHGVRLCMRESNVYTYGCGVCKGHNVLGSFNVYTNTCTHIYTICLSLK